MPEQCPKDGGFIGSCGCTHPNHEHSALVKQVIADSRDPYEIEPDDAAAALEEGFYVNSRHGTRVGFGRQLLEHIRDSHDPDEADNRLAKLLYAVDTAKTGRRKPNPQGGAGSFGYAKQFRGFRILVLTDTEGVVERAFTFFDKGAGASSSSFQSSQLRRRASPNNSSSALVQHGLPSEQNPNTGLEYNSSMTRSVSSGVQTSGARTLHKVSSVIRPMP